MANIIVVRYPTGKVETMKSFDLQEQIFDIIPFIPTNDLESIKVKINREIEDRKNEELIKLKNDAIKSLSTFLNAGGYVISGGVTYSSIGEDFDLKEPIIFLS